jgi:hypothetical protein
MKLNFTILLLRVYFLNFVEAMALCRAFSVGRFKCSNASPKITPAEYLRDGYVLAIKKNSVNKFCINCFQSFFSSKGLRVTDCESYLTIESSLF